MLKFYISNGQAVLEINCRYSPGHFIPYSTTSIAGLLEPSISPCDPATVSTSLSIRSFNMGSKQRTLTRQIHHWSLRWRHNGRDSVSNLQPHDCLLNRLFRRRSKKTSKFRVTGLCVGKQMVSNAENVSIWWRHHVKIPHSYRFPQLHPTYSAVLSCPTI